MRQPYPLQWPDNWDRTEPAKRERALFRVTLAEGIQDLLYELRLMRAENVVITSDLPPTSKGYPYSGGKSEDPGIAVWCVLDGSERVFACDRWTTPAANLRAIGKTVEALRGLANWGAADMVTRAFQGFAALPAGGQEMAPNPASTAKKGWRDVLLETWDTDEARLHWYRCITRKSSPSDRKDAMGIFRSLHREAIRTAHPDVGGTHERAAELNVALHDAEVELGGAA
jgi:hypothetical protein